MNKNLIIIFTRNPELGKCKTRLAKTIGDNNALTVYKMLLAHTKQVASELAYDKAVYYSVKIRPNDLWEGNGFYKFQQQGNDLGERMLHAFSQGFNDEYDKVLIIGSDLYDLTSNHIEKAFKALDSHDAVIGPALDGGYYLLGMKHLIPEVFKNKDWGTATVFESTVNDLKSFNVATLETLNDIDVFDDIKDYDIFKPYLVQH